MAPIVLFTYNRADHVKQVIESLLRNAEAAASDLIIYSDAAGTSAQLDSVEEVRAYIHSITGFAHVRIIEREENVGLRKNITDGVTTVVNRYGRVIVLEDDIVVDRYFLNYMNTALDRYENEKRVFEIDGYTCPFDSTDLPETYFLNEGDCWGWATWKDRWASYSRDPGKVYSEATREDIYRFNKNGSEYLWTQVMMNYEGTLDTWAVFKEYIIFRTDSLCLFPRESLSHNAGFDGSGTNCDESGLFYTKSTDACIAAYPSQLEVNPIAESRKQEWFLNNLSLKCRITPLLDEIITHKLQGRTLALWGMGHYGKCIWQELCAPQYRDIKVELFDGGKLKPYYEDPQKLEGRADEYFVLESIISPNEKIYHTLTGFGFSHGKDFCGIETL